MIKSNRTNRARIQSAVQRGDSDNLRDISKFQPTSDHDEGLPMPSSSNLFDEIMQEQKRNTYLLSTITKKSDKQSNSSK